MPPEMGSPEWWLKKLGGELDARHSRLVRFDNYYNGHHELAFASRKFKSAFGRTFEKFAVNFMELVVDAVEERLNVEGFRIDDETGDKDAWEVWQANNLDSESQIAHTEALVKEQSYALVWGDGDRAQITIEDPLQMVVAHGAENRRQRRAALKRWIDDSGLMFATLYLPNEIKKYQSRNKIDPNLYTNLSEVQWEPRQGDEGMTNPLGEVPVIPLVNKPRLSGCGQSEIQSVLPIQDALDKTALDMLVAAEFGAFRQRWMTGVEIPRDPDTNEPIEPFKSAVDRLWGVEDENAKFGEFGQTDLAPYVKAAEMFVQQIASITRTPPHYLLGSSGSFPSGESLKATETGLVAKARRKMRHFGESWEQVIRLAFKVTGNPKAEVASSETIWRDPESRTESEHVAALIQLKSLGVPDRQLQEDAGYSPQQIARFDRMKTQDALMNALTPSLLETEPENA